MATLSRDSYLSRATSSSRDNSIDDNNTFPFLRLPLELRLKIYSLILNPRIHTIVTHHPRNGYPYTSSPPFRASSSRSSASPKSSKHHPLSAPYKVLTTNFRASCNSSSISTSILRLSKQIHAEAEPVLYAGKGTVFDFGVHVEALVGFWEQRSERARSVVREVRVAGEVDGVCVDVENARDMEAASGAERESETQKDERRQWRWKSLSQFIVTALPGLRRLDLTLWAPDGSSLAAVPLALPSPLSSNSSSPISTPSSYFPHPHLHQQFQPNTPLTPPHSPSLSFLSSSPTSASTSYSPYFSFPLPLSLDWARDLLLLPALTEMRITWWAKSHGELAFDPWLVGKMVGDEFFRGRMVAEGVMREERTVVRT